MNIKVIKTQSDYEAAIARLSLLMSKDFAQSLAEEQEENHLAFLIESYESLAGNDEC